MISKKELLLGIIRLQDLYDELDIRLEKLEKELKNDNN